jgi:hypothetical protein
MIVVEECGCLSDGVGSEGRCRWKVKCESRCRVTSCRESSFINTSVDYLREWAWLALAWSGKCCSNAPLTTSGQLEKVVNPLHAHLAAGESGQWWYEGRKGRLTDVDFEEAYTRLGRFRLASPARLYVFAHNLVNFAIPHANIP